MEHFVFSSYAIRSGLGGIPVLYIFYSLQDRFRSRVLVTALGASTCAEPMIATATRAGSEINVAALFFPRLKAFDRGSFQPLDALRETFVAVTVVVA